MSKLQSKRSSASLLIPVHLSLWACSGQDDSVRGVPPEEMNTPHESRVQGPLTLEERSAEHLSGIFVNQAGGLRFDVKRAQGQGWIVLETLHGQTILRVVHSLDAESAAAAYRIGLASQSSIEVMSFEDLLALPEAVLLPALSYELGTYGIRGDTDPSSFPLHLLALSVARASSSNHSEMLNQPSKGDSITESTQELVSCQTEPQGDKCSGRCGSNCDCWQQVCGDCCWHQGCQIHDWTGFYCENYLTCCDSYLTFQSYFWATDPCSQEPIDQSIVDARCKPESFDGGGGSVW